MIAGQVVDHTVSDPRSTEGICVSQTRCVFQEYNDEIHQQQMEEMMYLNGEKPGAPHAHGAPDGAPRGRGRGAPRGAPRGGILGGGPPVRGAAPRYVLVEGILL